MKTPELFTKNLKLRLKQSLTALTIDKFLSDETRDVAKKVLPEFMKGVARLVETTGIRNSVRLLKLRRLAITRYLSGTPFSQLDYVRLDETGWPYQLPYLKPLSHTAEGIRYLLTLLTILRDECLAPVPDLTPITETWKGKDLRASKGLHFRICRELGIKKGMNMKWKSYHFTTKAGPHGQALVTSIQDLENMGSELLRHVGVVGGRLYSSYLETVKTKPFHRGVLYADAWKEIFPPSKQPQSLRKLSYFGDKEGKTRIIAILDYYSQSALKPLHDSVSYILRGIKNDCTYDQGHFKNVLPKEGIFYSFDLSNATDRMPIRLQKRIVARLAGKKYADSWEYLLVGEPFEITLPDKTKKFVKYGCGQPMGAYSSWPMMALTHHYIVKYSALKVGITNFQDYCILGDDIVIANKSVADSYERALRRLDMPISLQKTHVSNHMYEFAKRWMYRGEEVTPFSIGGLVETSKRYMYLQNFIETQQNHGWSLPEDRHPGYITNIFSLLGKPSQATRLTKLYMLFRSIVETKKEGVFSGKVIKTASELFFPLCDLPDDLPSYEEGLMRKIALGGLERDMRSADYAELNFQNEFRKRLDNSGFPRQACQAYISFSIRYSPAFIVSTDLVEEMKGKIIEFKLNPSKFDNVFLDRSDRKMIYSDRTFTQRRAVAHLHSISRFVKAVLSEMRDKAQHSRSTNHERTSALTANG